jgi:hypothetical protein
MRKVWLHKKTNFNTLNNEILEFQLEQFLHKCTDVENMSNRFTHKYLEMVGRRIRLNDLILKLEKKYVLVIDYTNELGEINLINLCKNINRNEINQ